jgi:hypothetical protein
MNTAWHFKSTTSSCNGEVTSPDGYAICSRSIGHPSKGYTVRIEVTFVVNGAAVAHAQTEFTPQ